MSADKMRVFSRLMAVFVIVTLGFFLGSNPPNEIQRNQPSGGLLAGRLPAETNAPNADLSFLCPGTSNAAAAEGESGDDTAEDPGGVPVRTVRVGIYQNPPKVFIDEEGVPSGIFVNLLDEIAREENWDLVYVPCEWSDCLAALEGHRIDLMPDVAYSRERDERYDFHEIPVVDSWSQVYANSSTPITTLSDLNGLRISMLRGGIQEEIFRQMMNGFGFEATIIQAETYEEAFGLAGHGYVDAVVSNHFIGDYLFQEYGLTKTPIVFSPTSLYFATARGRNHDILDAIDHHLDNWRRQPDSYYYRTLARWMARPPEQVVPRYLIWIVVATAGCLLLAIGIIQLLRTQVKAKTEHLVRANELLRESEEKYRLLVENLNDVIFCLDEQGSIIYLSPVAGSLFVYKPKEIIGRPFSDFVHPDDLQGVVKSREETLGGMFNPYEFRMVDKNGDIHYVRTSSRPVEKEGRATGITGVLTDITREREAEKALRESERKHRTILNTIDDGYFEVDLEGNFTAFNESMKNMLGYDDSEMVGLNYRRFMTSDVAVKAFSTFKEVSKTGVPAKAVDWRLTRKDGTIVDIETSVSLKRDASGVPVGFFGISRDLTEKKKMELQFIQTEKLSAIGTMISGVAHELNNPLTAIIGNAQMLIRQEVPDDIKHKLEVILKESIRSSKIIGGLLTFAREHTPERSMVDINSIVMESVKLKEYDLRVNNIDLKLDLSEALPITSADPYQVQQVFINIINNARDALVGGQGKGVLTIRTYRSDGTIVIAFEDTGPGIPEESIKKIFEPFFTTKETGKGTGLGLSMAQDIIKEHDGEISVESKPGAGATFTVVLPIASVKTQAAPANTDQHGERGTKDAKSILVVEDEENLVHLILEALTAEGYDVTCSNSGNSAIDQLKKNRYDLIISDMKMPGMSGEELYRYVEENYPPLKQKVFFMTGDILGKNTQDFLKTTGNNYIEKPFEINRLVQAVNKIM